ncbi:MAG TPA: alpha/beta hydrolase [Pseudonocardia sp.]|jgi:pimeloyl-ACP methyl ester carboxylesterase|nr:alpha/beta hydrolase [Pseudonocardia sp.]
MTPSSTVPATAATLRVPGASLHHEVRGQGPLVVLVGAPMDATAFAPLADLLATDHTVLTTDPRGVHRSPVDDLHADSTPELRADDLSRLITALDAGPATVLGSSGGAVTALALLQAHREQVATVIAHEPPLTELLPDREQLLAGTEAAIATYLAGDRVGAWRAFLAQADITMPEEVFQAMFASPREPAQAADERHWFAHEMLATTAWRPDLAVLGPAADRVVVGIGTNSTGELCDRTSTALATALGIEPTRFPGGHTGFVEDPAAFATRLRAVLAER